MRKLIYFGFARLDEMLKKGNVWYVRHYEAYFDKVYVVYLSGKPHEPVINGNTTLVSLGTGNGIVNLILAPYRLYKFAKKIKPTTYLTADQIFSWWTSWLVKLLLKAKTYLMPVCMPEQIYKSSGKSLSGQPIWVERIMIFLSYLSSNKVLTGYSFGSFVPWLQKHKLAKGKLIVVEKLAESVSPKEFIDAIQKTAPQKIACGVTHLIYVGRLHHEKLVDGLIKMMSVLKTT